MYKNNPFAKKSSPGWPVPYTVTLVVRDRLKRVRNFSAVELLAVLRLRGVQKTVRLAAQRRLNKIFRPLRPTPHSALCTPHS